MSPTLSKLPRAAAMLVAVMFVVVVCWGLSPVVTGFQIRFRDEPTLLDWSLELGQSLPASVAEPRDVRPGMILEKARIASMPYRVWPGNGEQQMTVVFYGCWKVNVPEVVDDIDQRLKRRSANEIYDIVREAIVGVSPRHEPEWWPKDLIYYAAPSGFQRLPEHRGLYFISRADPTRTYGAWPIVPGH